MSRNLKRKLGMRLALMCFAVTLATVHVARANDLVMPRDLVAVATKMGCIQINAFYDRPGPTDPPFVYGYLSGNKDDSAVFWCKKPEPDDKPYRLVIVTKDPKHANQCPDHIDWWNPPKGLSISRGSVLRLKDFRYVNNPNQPGPDLKYVQGNVIVSSYDGVTESLYCDDGKWLYLIRH